MNDLIPHQPEPTEQDEDTPPAPCFDGLTPMQSAFVRAYVEAGDGNASKAARTAGYAAASANVAGARLLRQQSIQAALISYTQQALAAHAPVALGTMVGLLHARSEFVRQTAAADLLNRSGFKPPERHQIRGAGGVTIDIKLD
jgi:hypothetical protein